MTEYLLCAECQKPITPPQLRYCSKKCRVRALNRRNRDPEQSRKSVALYRQRHPDRVREANRRQYQEHRDERIAKQREYTRQNPDKLAKWHQTARQNSPWRGLLGLAKKRASDKGLAFDLTIEWARDRWNGRCELTDLPFALEPTGIGGPKQFSPTIDRIVPALGYTKDNCRFILQAVNSLKSNGTDESMLIIALALVRRSSMGSQFQ